MSVRARLSISPVGELIKGDLCQHINIFMQHHYIYYAKIIYTLFNKMTCLL